MCDSKRRSFLKSSAALLTGAALSSKHAHSHAPDPHDNAIHHSTPAHSMMAETAARFLAALSPDQLVQVNISFTADERRNFHYVPIERKGLPLRDMTPYQRHLATALLAAGLSQTGFIKAITIMSLEDVLKIMENASADYRNPEKYYFSLFGTPSETGTWGYRVEGHHISQNYTVTNGEVICAPSFFGSNPAEVRIGPRKGLRALAAEDELGFTLIGSLDEQQQKVAIVNPTAYGDILTSQKRIAALEGQPSGLPLTSMKSNQIDALHALVELYAHNMPDDMARRRMQQLDSAGRDIHFAWAGGTQPGDPHYYRVQTPSFLIELDNTQDKANHIHSVWRDFTHDFGNADPLRAHYQGDHQSRRA